LRYTVISPKNYEPEAQRISIRTRLAWLWGLDDRQYPLLVATDKNHVLDALGKVASDIRNVSLEDVVDNETDKNIAGLRAKGVPGTFSVTNNLQVVSPK